MTKDEPVAWMLQRSNDDSLYALAIEFFGFAQSSGLLQNLEENILVMYVSLITLTR